MRNKDLVLKTNICCMSTKGLILNVIISIVTSALMLISVKDINIALIVVLPIIACLIVHVSLFFFHKRKIVSLSNSAKKNMS
jgi:uncharacterized protein YacL